MKVHLNIANKLALALLCTIQKHDLSTKHFALHCETQCIYVNMYSILLCCLEEKMEDIKA
jgi:hypothetical protein